MPSRIQRVLIIKYDGLSKVLSSTPLENCSLIHSQLSLKGFKLKSKIYSRGLDKPLLLWNGYTFNSTKPFGQ